MRENWGRLAGSHVSAVKARNKSFKSGFTVGHFLKSTTWAPMSGTKLLTQKRNLINRKVRPFCIFSSRNLKTGVTRKQ